MKLSISEPEPRDSGPILVCDEALNDIAEFYHNEHATVGQSYETALMLAQALVRSADKFDGLTFRVQYRRKDNEIHWHNMAAFDVVLAAEDYFKQQGTDDGCPWEYQLIDLEEEK